MSSESSRGDFWFLTVAVLLGFLVRFAFLVATDFVIDSDEAIVGLMARHFLEGRPWSIFYYGQPYMGSLEPTLTSAVFYFTGATSAALKSVPLIFSLWLILAVYALGVRLGGAFTGRVAALFVALPPPGLVEWSTKARGGFVELVLLGTLALVLAADVAKTREGRSGRLVLLGLVSGLAWWTNNQAIFYLVAIAVTLLLYLWKDGFRAILRAVSVAGAAFLVGGGPFWWANLVSQPRFQTFKHLGHGARPGDVLESLGRVFSDSIPILTGAKRFWSLMEAFPGATAFVAVLYISAFLVLCLGFRRQNEPNPARLLVLTLLIASPLVFAGSAFGWLTHAPRYLLPLYAAFAVMTGFFCQWIAVRFRSPAMGVLVALIAVGFNAVTNYAAGMNLPGQPFVYGHDRVARDQAPLYALLRSRGVDHIKTNYWIGYRVAFETEERVTFSVFGEPKQWRIAEYQDFSGVFPGEAPYVLTRSQAREFGAAMSQRGYRFRSTVAGEYLVFDLIEPVVDNLVQLPIRKDQITATSRQDWVGNLTDGNLGSRWGSGAPQSPGMSLSVRFDRPVTVAGVRLAQGFWPQDASRWVSVEVVDARGATCSVFDGAIGDTVFEGDGDFRIYLGRPILGTELRIVQRGAHPVFDWSVAELEVFTPAE